MEAQKFEDFLRKEVNFSMKKYAYASGKVGEGTVLDSPAGKMNRIKEMVFLKEWLIIYFFSNFELTFNYQNETKNILEIYIEPFFEL